MEGGQGHRVIAALPRPRRRGNYHRPRPQPPALPFAPTKIRAVGFSATINVLQQDLFGEHTADLIVCNPPWLPAKPTSAVETALYDPKHAMLHAFLRGAAAHLAQGGQVWLVMSNLAELLGLRGAHDLANWFTQYGWRVVGSLKTTPQHRKASDRSDPLAFARQREITTLYILERA